MDAEVSHPNFQLAHHRAQLQACEQRLEQSQPAAVDLLIIQQVDVQAVTKTDSSERFRCLFRPHSQGSLNQQWQLNVFNAVMTGRD